MCDDLLIEAKEVTAFYNKNKISDPFKITLSLNYPSFITTNQFKGKKILN